MSTNKFKHQLFAGLVAAALGLSLAPALPAADSTTGPSADRAAEHGKSGKTSDTLASRDLRASKVIGMRVRNAQDESLGKIDDLIIDINNERVAYAILAFGGTLGFGQKLFAYPVSLFQPSASRNNELVLSIDQDKLRQAPGFERRTWPDWNQAGYRDQVERHFGPGASPKAMPNQRLVRAGELIGKKVGDRGGKPAGQIEDLVVNLGHAKVHYAVLDPDRAWSIDDKLLPLPLKSFSFPDDKKKDAMLKVARNELDMSHGFDARKWPDIGDPAYQRSVDNHLERTAAASRRAGEGQAGPLREE